MIRLLQITHDLAIGGLQQVVATICKTIDRNRFDISVLCLRNLGEFTAEFDTAFTLIDVRVNGVSIGSNSVQDSIPLNETVL